MKDFTFLLITLLYTLVNNPFQYTRTELCCCFELHNLVSLSTIKP